MVGFVLCLILLRIPIARFLPEQSARSIEGVRLIILQDILLTEMDLTFSHKFVAVIYACRISMKDN